MAKAYANCATEGCSNQILFVEQNRKLADRKAAWAESQGFICADCDSNKRAEENAKAAAQNAASGLPALTGSDKQVAWAETIRAEKLETIRQAIGGELPRIEFEAYWGSYGLRSEALPVDHAQRDYAIALLRGQTGAAWWIENRERKVGFLLSELFIANPPQSTAIPDQQSVIAELAAEATVRPDEAKTETIAEIQHTSNSVTVKFPEKRESFRLLMRENGFVWTGADWARQLADRNGSGKDRAAEIGHILLGNGFIIRIYDDETRALAVSGDFDPEQTRWVLLYTSGEHQGKLCIRWGKDEDFYKAAKRIPTARYAKPAIAVSVEQFEQALDFSEVNGFAIAEAAQAAMDAARQARDRALVAHVELAPREKRSDNGKPTALAVPESVDVDNDLRD